MAERRVVIENRKTGEQYAVTPAAFRKHYDGAGFRILHWEGGEEYTDAPASAADSGTTSDRKEKRAARARERRAAKRAAALSEPVGPQPEAEPTEG